MGNQEKNGPSSSVEKPALKFPQAAIFTTLKYYEGSIDKSFIKKTNLTMTINFLDSEAAKHAGLVERYYQQAGQEVIEKYFPKWMGKLHLHFVLPGLQDTPKPPGKGTASHENIQTATAHRVDETMGDHVLGPNKKTQ